MFLIAGPCSIEDDGQIALETAHALKEIGRYHDIPVIFKTSWHKANRTSGASYRGIDSDKALDIFTTIKRETGLPVTTDVHERVDVVFFSEFIDVLQVPALLSRQTDLIETCADWCDAMTIKKGQFIAPHNVKPMVEKATSMNPNISLAVIERGQCFGYNDLVVDFRGFKIMSEAVNCPIIFDATHTVQYPQRSADSSGGDRAFVAPLARAAAATGYVDGFFIETHPNPDKALCDGPCMVKLDDMGKLVGELKEIYDIAQRTVDRSPRPFQFNQIAG